MPLLPLAAFRRDRPVAIDLTRLITRLKHPSPTGIDRVDLAYARHFLAQGEGPRFGLVSTALGPRLLPRSAALKVVDRVVAGWIEDVAAEDDPAYRALRARLGDPLPVGEGTGSSAGAIRRAASGRRRAFAETELLALRAPDARRTLPPGSLYLHTSHLRLDKPGRFDWLYDRADVAPVFFVHDLIPIEYPEYGRPGEAARHAERMLTVGRHARAVIVNSGDVGARFSTHLARLGRPVPPVTVAWLGIEPAFHGASGEDPPARPVFVAVSTVEPRKNYHFLLTLWRTLGVRHGAATPHLVLVGRRGWESENVVDLLERSPGVRAHVIEAPGLSTAGLVRLLRAATALVMPSHAEGYGLPVLEAAAVGLPVLASDIPVHREIAGGFATFLDPLDGPGWTRAVEALAAPGSPEGTAMRARLAGFAPPTWAEHFARVDAALASLA